eukprot:GFKZ01000894.1.p1 GENE.GFKZ01000894.1~~GFKZ01000894.1.p1  ORF type:complete len:462 (-),score=31.94 GFKZ01000894.1:423-1808(-)
MLRTYLKVLVICTAIAILNFSATSAATLSPKSVRNPHRLLNVSNSAQRSREVGPFSGKRFYVNNDFAKRIQTTMNSVGWPGNEALDRIRSAPTAIWLYAKQTVTRDEDSRVLYHLRQAANQDPAPVVTFVLYNLPNRDCGAGASSGELCCNTRADGSCDVFNQSGDCNSAVEEYKRQFVDPLVTSAKEFCGRVPMAFIIEPDSIPNIVTSEVPACGQATKSAYRKGIKYAVENLHLACPSAPIYVDAAHGSWLGWEKPSTLFVEEIRRMEIASKIRGFSVNLSGFQEMGILCPSVGFCNGGANSDHPCCKADFCQLSSEYNPGFTLLNYAASLRSISSSILPWFRPHFVIDTSRNGVPNARKESCANWCNIRDAGVGPLATSFTAVPKLIDAYMWIKTPGESDGCTKLLPDGNSCSRFSAECESGDSIGSRPEEPRAPEAGGWFNYSITSLATNGLRMGTI